MLDEPLPADGYEGVPVAAQVVEPDRGEHGEVALDLGGGRLTAGLEPLVDTGRPVTSRSRIRRARARVVTVSRALITRSRSWIFLTLPRISVTT